MALTDSLIGDKPIKVEVGINQESKMALIAFTVVIFIAIVFVGFRAGKNAQPN